jgi:hypothetical protein
VVWLLLPQKGLQGGNQRPAALVAHDPAALRRGTVHLALDGEEHIDMLHRLDGDPRLLQPVEAA